MLFLNKNTREGFTLIELLVVIAIIGTLASVVLASLNGARVKARDARRVSDLKEIQKALELYYSNHGSYPSGGAGSDRAEWRNNGTSNFTSHPLGRLVADGLISKISVDPGANTYVQSGAGCGHAQFYMYKSDGQRYQLGAVNESQGFTGCTDTGSWAYFDDQPEAATHYKFQYYIKNY